MKFPESSLIETSKLSAVFNKTTASYKFYWFISLLEIFNNQDETIIPIRNILSRMICNAWYPVHYFKLSFGHSDMLSKNSKEIQLHANITEDISKDELYNHLIKSKDKEILKRIDHFDQQVPFRFLSPWFPGLNDSNVAQQSQSFANNCLYRINRKDRSIEINPNWRSYLKNNCRILLDFCYWNLAMFLQSKNPNTPDIPNKLIKPIKRSSMVQQRNFWKILLASNADIKCIYTDKSISLDNFDVEHFIPYSFVSHNLLWNLIPAVSDINRSKNNKIPDLNVFGRKYAKLQKAGIHAAYQKAPTSKLLEDFLILGGSIPDLLFLSEEDFYKRYYEVLSPLAQIALNQGFEKWNYK